MPTVIGLDYGLRRTGIAVSDDAGRLAFPLGTHREGVDGSIIVHLRGIANDRHVVAIVLGLPLTADGRETEMAGRVRRFAEVLTRDLGLPVHLCDERYSSQEAKRIRSAGGGPRSKEQIDAVAAAIILQTWLDIRKRSGEGAT